MSNTYKTYKLSSGDEIIGKLVGNNLDVIEIHRPMIIKLITFQNPMSGEMKEMSILRPWNDMSNELTCKIKREHIILESEPTPDIIEIYHRQVEKEDVINDLYKDLMNDPERMESYIKDIIENDINSIPENIENDEDQVIPDQVQMNFRIPNEMFLAFLMNGIVSLDPEREDEEEITGLDFNIQEFLNMKKGLPPKKNDDNDIDNYFKNWNPEP
tara:strand:+ start:19061 stop:19702 length:642 start_codon:yes stop_codon:yes gene_type:complete